MKLEQLIERLKEDSSIEDFRRVGTALGERLSKKDPGSLQEKMSYSQFLLENTSSKSVYLMALMDVMHGFLNWEREKNI